MKFSGASRGDSAKHSPPRLKRKTFANSLPVSLWRRKTRNKHRGYAGQVFNLAVDYGYLPANPVTKIKRFNERSTEEDEISILSADETKRLFRVADPAVIPSDALLLLRSPGRHSRTSFVGRCKVRRTAGDCSQV